MLLDTIPGTKVYVDTTGLLVVLAKNITPAEMQVMSSDEVVGPILAKIKGYGELYFVEHKNDVKIISADILKEEFTLLGDL